ncbi:MAG: 50S ribosomal protein L4 [Planctomycetota bacterium]|nr:MAG: 50S ribosomal protein L4 [Planctomycetota bacterium]
MVTLPIFNENGEQQGDLEIDTSLLGDAPNIELIKQAVVMYQANKRQGTHKTKCRNEIKGSKKKLWKQKGTGRARVGTAKVPHFVGGGHAFALRPRDYSKAMNKKARDVAFKSALLAKILGNSVVIVDGIDFDKPQTKRARKMINSLKISGKSVFASSEVSNSLLLSFRNLEGTRIKKVSDLNTLDVMNCKKLIVDKAGLESFLKASK